MLEAEHMLAFYDGYPSSTLCPYTLFEASSLAL